MDLSLLERMVETDPHNPSFSSEIAKLLAYKVPPTKKLLESLKKQIELGITSVPCLLLIGEGFFNVGSLNEAQKYWELAIEKAPDNINGLNNLATCLIAISASNADRAIDLVSKANLISPNNADILDTWGEAFLAANRPKEAVNKLELAIRIDNNRMDSRIKLITAYEALGMKAMAEAQSKVLRSLKDAQSKATLEIQIIPTE
jgi:tetratricopeptide (TPR) repeat protein